MNKFLQIRDESFGLWDVVAEYFHVASASDVATSERNATVPEAGYVTGAHVSAEVGYADRGAIDI